LLGYVGQDPEVHSTGSGTVVASFSLATKYRAADANIQTEWHRLAAFGRAAEIVRDYVYKGSKVYVEGHLQTREWQKDGVTRISTQVVIDGLSLLNSRAADQSKAKDMHCSNLEIKQVDETF